LPHVPSVAQNQTVVPVVLPHAWVSRINRLAIEQGINRSALIRQALAATYGVDQPTPSTAKLVDIVVTPVEETASATSWRTGSASTGRSSAIAGLH
jgi:hypothetical protein